jgi:hypothetical protein
MCLQRHHKPALYKDIRYLKILSLSETVRYFPLYHRITWQSALGEKVIMHQRLAIPPDPATATEAGFMRKTGRSHRQSSSLLPNINHARSCGQMPQFGAI